MENVIDCFSNFKLWTKEENSQILINALDELSERLKQTSTAEEQSDKALCKKHLERLAFYSHLVHNCWPEASQAEVSFPSVESEILVQDIDMLLSSPPALVSITLQKIHDFDKRLFRILMEDKQPSD